MKTINKIAIITTLLGSLVFGGLGYKSCTKPEVNIKEITKYTSNTKHRIIKTSVLENILDELNNEELKHHIMMRAVDAGFIDEPKYLDQAIQYNETENNPQDAAELCIKLGDYKRAKLFYERVIAESEANKDFGRAALFSEYIYDFDEAKRFKELAIQESEEEGKFIIAAMDCEYELKDKERAKKNWELALPELEKNGNFKRCIEIYKDKNPKKAEFYRELLTRQETIDNVLEQHNPNILMSNYFKDKDDMRKSQEYLDIAVKDLEESLDFETIAEVFLNRNDEAKANEYLEKGIQYFTEHDKLFHVAKLCDKLGDKERANSFRKRIEIRDKFDNIYWSLKLDDKVESEDFEAAIQYYVEEEQFRKTAEMCDIKSMNERADGFYKQYIEKRLSVFPINSYSDVINNCKEYTWFNVFGDKFLHQIAGLYLRLGDQEKAKEFYGYEAALYEDSGLFYKSANIHEQFLENTVKADELIRLGLKKSLEKSDFDHLELFFDYMDNSMKAEAIHKAARSCHFEEAATLCNKAGNPEMENVYVELDEIFSR